MNGVEFHPLPSNHLTDQQLQKLLASDGGLPTDIEFNLDHLDYCPACQQRFQELTPDHGWWQSMRSEWLAPSRDSAVEKLNLEPPYDPEHLETDRFDPVRYLTSRMAAAPQAGWLGQIDEFLIERVVGMGGMGIVFKGQDSELNRVVAIKFLAPHLDDFDLARQRFFREAKSAAAVCHENVVPIYRIGTHRGMPFFVMPFISNDSLHSLVERCGPLDLKTLVQIGVQMAAGIAAAHEQGLVHRDIKPGNVLLENELNRVLISDFGLAHDFRSHTITATGLIAGTPGYMSPEQAAGKPVEYRSDLFSMGSVLFFAATGKMPFTGENSLLILDRIRTQSVSLRDHRSDLPSTFVAIVEKLMAKRVEHRYGSASEAKQALMKYLSELNVEPPKRTALHSFFAAPRGQPKSWWRVAAGVSAILFVAIFAILRGERFVGEGPFLPTNFSGETQEVVPRVSTAFESKRIDVPDSHWKTDPTNSQFIKPSNLEQNLEPNLWLPNTRPID